MARTLRTPVLASIRLGLDLAAKLGTDPAKWPEAAKAIAGGWESFAKGAGITIPDVGNAAKEGGTTAGQEKSKAPSVPGLSDAMSKVVGSITLPGEAKKA